jgi:hypothetical protein
MQIVPQVAPVMTKQSEVTRQGYSKVGFDNPMKRNPESARQVNVRIPPIPVEKQWGFRPGGSFGKR